MHAAKIVKVQHLALKMGAPLVGLNDSGGARIQEAVDAMSGYGKIFFNNTLASGVTADLGNYGTFSRRRSLQSGTDRLYLYGQKHL